MLWPTFLIFGSSRIGLSAVEHAFASSSCDPPARRRARNSRCPCSQLKLMPTRLELIGAELIGLGVEGESLLLLRAR